MNESAGFAAISVDLFPWLLLIVLAVVVVGGWKLSSFLWALFK